MVDASKRLQECFRLVFPGLSAEEIPQAAQASIASWDSLASVTLVAVVEEEFGIGINEDEFQDMISFGQVLEVVNSKVSDD